MGRLAYLYIDRDGLVFDRCKHLVAAASHVLANRFIHLSWWTRNKITQRYSTPVCLILVREEDGVHR